MEKSHSNIQIAALPPSPLSSGGNSEDSVRQIYRGLNSTEIRNALVEGPLECRWELWTLAVKYKKDENFERILEAKLADGVETLIEKDLDRTFPLNQSFHEYNGQNTLKKVLGTLSVRIPKVGYCQGMNFVVGVIVITSKGNSEESHSFAEKIFCEMGASELYLPNFPLVTKFLRVFHRTLREIKPDVERNLRALDIQDSL